MEYPCNNCCSHSTDCQKTCSAYLAYLRQSSVEAEIEQLENKFNKPISITANTTTLTTNKQKIPLQVKESDFKGDDNHYYFNKSNFSFHICIKPDNGFMVFYKHIEVFKEDIKYITLSEAVTAINNYLKQLYEEVLC